VEDEGDRRGGPEVWLNNDARPLVSLISRLDVEDHPDEEQIRQTGRDLSDGEKEAVKYRIH
jgi:hypothetical protein